MSEPQGSFHRLSRKNAGKRPSWLNGRSFNSQGRQGSKTQVLDKRINEDRKRPSWLNGRKRRSIQFDGLDA